MSSFLGTGKTVKQASKTFLSISSFEVLVQFRRGLFYSYLSIYLRFFLGLSVTETTLLATFSMLVNVIFQTFVWGRVSDKLQLRRTLIIIGEIIAALITFGVWYAHTLPGDKAAAGYAIIIGMTVVEVFWSMSNLGWSALISDLYPSEKRAGLQGRIQSIGAIGRMTGIFIGGMLYDGLSKQYDGWGFESGVLFIIASGVMLISTIPMFLAPEGGVASEKGRNHDTPPPQKIPHGIWKSSLSAKFAIFLLAMILVNFGMNAIVFLKPQYLSLDEGFGVSSRLLGYILNMGALATFLIGLSIGRMSGRLNDGLLLITGNLISIAHLLIYIFAVNLPTVFVGEFLAGAARVIIMASSYSYAARLIPPEKRGRQFALFNATFFLSWGVPGTLITGPLTDYLIREGNTQLFSYQMAFVAAAGLLTIGSLVLLLNMKMKDPQEKQD